MKKIIYVTYFIVLANYLLPVGDLVSMASDLGRSVSYQVVSSAPSTGCFSLGDLSMGAVKDNVSNIFSAYGAAARNNVCSL